MTNSYDDEDGTIPLSGLDRDRVWREWGIDLQDTTRMADDPEWAQECLWRWRGGEYVRGLRHHRLDWLQCIRQSDEGRMT